MNSYKSSSISTAAHITNSTLRKRSNSIDSFSIQEQKPRMKKKEMVDETQNKSGTNDAFHIAKRKSAEDSTETRKKTNKTSVKKRKKVKHTVNMRNNTKNEEGKFRIVSSMIYIVFICLI